MPKRRASTQIKREDDETPPDVASSRSRTLPADTSDGVPSPDSPPSSPPAATGLLEGQGQFVFDPHGDLQLRVTGVSTSIVSGTSLEVESHRSVVFRVSSEVLEFTSPKWRALVRSDNPSDHRPRVWETEICANPEALRLLLNLMHGNIDSVPNRLITLKNLLDIIFLAEKYDSLTLLRPRAAAWRTSLDGVLGLRGKEHNPEDLGRALCIAWWLGDTQRTLEALKRIAMNSSVSKGGCLVIPGERLRYRFNGMDSDPMIKLDVVSRMTRKVMIIELHSFWKATLKGLDGSNATGCVRCRAPDVSLEERRKCEGSILGSLVQKMVHKQLWPFPDPHSITSSPEDFKRQLLSLEPAAASGALHGASCGVVVENHPSDGMIRRLERIQPTLLESQLQELRVNAHKLGLPATAPIS
ncbi:hypothetical protein JX265_007413 [Neoarthrinium moseri]|uniref:BTB domain-containing protein n=1 Tax=Neoarthrinium moseri TaxID=1658444 RepID=A0A9P9WK60_9PEZI|nr:hypothetical protein JX265_007413 [Neoarthrinium moseri]